MGNVCSSGNSHYIQRQNNQLHVTSQKFSSLSLDVHLVLGPPVMYEERWDEPLRAGAARHGQRGESTRSNK